jgi:uncharacterized RmlC-like cupin family protein
MQTSPFRRNTIWLSAAIWAAVSPVPANAQPTSSAPDDIVTIRASADEPTKQGLPRFHGISGSSAGAQKLSLHKVRIPPGGSAKAHVHKGYETAVYLIKGRVETRYGEGLKKSTVNESGDFLYIPADVPHQPFNLSETEWAEAIVARTDPNEQESVEPYQVKQGDSAQ